MVAPTRAAANAASLVKTTAHEALAATIRDLVKLIQAKSQISDESKQVIDITVSNEIKTAVEFPSTSPVGRIEKANRLEHIINFADWTTPTSKKKPARVLRKEAPISGLPRASVSAASHRAERLASILSKTASP